MYCNETEEDVAAGGGGGEDGSWLYDVILIDSDHFLHNATEPTGLNSGGEIYLKVLTVVTVVLVSLIGNCLVILSVAANKAMR